MIKLAIIFRSILRQKLNSGIIVISLAIGLACINLIFLFLNREINTDGFHLAKNQIYALKCDDPWTEGQQMNHTRYGSAEYMKDNLDEVEDICRINNASPRKVVVNNESYFDQKLMIAASRNFFEFFSYNLLTNNPKTVLEAENDLVISEDLAKKYFGSGPAVGQIITLVNRDKKEQMVVKGIFKNPKQNTQLKFDMVRAIKEEDSRCYIRIAENASPQKLEAYFEINKEIIPVIHGGTPGQYYLEPMQQAYFDTSRRSTFEASRDKTDLWIALVIGLLIIGIASFNFLGLVNNNLQRKNKMYSIFRVNGGSRMSFVFTFLSESGILIFISFCFSFFIMILMLPFFNNLIGTSITTGFMLHPKQLLISFVSVILLLVITFFFSLFRIRTEINSNLLKPGNNQQGKHIQLPAFNIFQLAATVALIVCSIVIVKQMSYITNKPIGLDKEVVEVKMPGQHSDKVSVFKEELLKNASINQVSVVGASPVLEHFLLLLKYEEGGVEKQYVPAGFSGDENYLSTLGIELIQGNDFSDNVASNQNKCIINQSLANLFPGQSLIGKAMPGMEDKIVVGIVNDFHYSSLKSMVEPAFISFDANGGHIMIKASENQIEQAHKAIAQTWAQLIPDYPLNIETIGDRYEWFHRENTNHIQLISACCFISIFLSMIGLFALSFQSSRVRIKEIGIRKVNGAKVSEIVALLNSGFVKWVIIAFVIATPVAWFAMDKWLQNFAYKTSLNWWIFALAGLLAMGIALITVSSQSFKAASHNPVEALKCE